MNDTTTSFSMLHKRRTSLSGSCQGLGAVQTGTQCPCWAVKLVPRSTDQGDHTSKSKIVPKSPSDTATSEEVRTFKKISCRVNGPDKRPHSPAQPRESVDHQPLLYPGHRDVAMNELVLAPRNKFVELSAQTSRAALFLILLGSQRHGCVQKIFIVLVRPQARQPDARVSDAEEREAVMWTDVELCGSTLSFEPSVAVSTLGLVQLEGGLVCSMRRWLSISTCCIQISWCRNQRTGARSNTHCGWAHRPSKQEPHCTWFLTGATRKCVVQSLDAAKNFSKSG